MPTAKVPPDPNKRAAFTVQVPFHFEQFENGDWARYYSHAETGGADFNRVVISGELYSHRELLVMLRIAEADGQHPSLIEQLQKELGQFATNAS